MAAAVTNAVKEGLPSNGSYLNTLISAIRKRPGKRNVDWTVKKAVENGQLPHVVECVQQPKITRVSIKSPGVLTHTIRGLRAYPQREGYSAESLNSALSRSRVLATLLDTKTKGYGRSIVSEDPRRSPELLGAYLEIVAANAIKHSSPNSAESVKTSADRLLSIFASNPSLIQQTWQVPKTGAISCVLDNFPIWHGLSLAQKVLKESMPQNALADRIIKTYAAGLQDVVEQLRSKKPKEDSYGGEAVWIWDNRIKV